MEACEPFERTIERPLRFPAYLFSLSDALTRDKMAGADVCSQQR